MTSAAHLMVLLDDNLVASLLDEARAFGVDPADIVARRLRETLPEALARAAFGALVEVLDADELAPELGRGSP